MSEGSRTFAALVNEFVKSEGVELKVKVTDTRKAVTAPLKKLMTILSEVPDPRQQGKVVYPLEEILLIVIVAMMAGAQNFIQIYDFWNTNKAHKLYKRLFKKEKVPSHDTIRRVMSLIPHEELNTSTVALVSKALTNLAKAMGIKEKREKTLLCVDGKELRGTGRKNTINGPIKNLQCLNVYDQYGDTCLFTDPIGSKTNEIPHAQKILASMNLKGYIVTFDAMNMQKETVRVICESGGDYCGGLKGNQVFASDYADNVFTTKLVAKYQSDPAHHLQTKEISHNQYEERNFYLYPLSKKEREGEFAEWKNARSLLCCVKTMINNLGDGSSVTEVRTYLTSLTKIEDAAYAARNHWSVESMHHGLDTVMQEDKLTVTDRVAGANLSAINGMITSLYRRLGQLLNKKSPISAKRVRFLFSIDFESMVASLLTLMDEDELVKALNIKK